MHYANLISESAGQPLEQPIFADNVFRFLVPFQQFVSTRSGLIFVHTFSSSVLRKNVYTKNLKPSLPGAYDSGSRHDVSSSASASCRSSPVSLIRWPLLTHGGSGVR